MHAIEEIDVYAILFGKKKKERGRQKIIDEVRSFYLPTDDKNIYSIEQKVEPNFCQENISMYILNIFIVTKKRQYKN